MAPESRREAPSLKRVLFEQTAGFDFLQAVRLLRRIAPDRDPVGGDFHPAREVVRFKSDLSPAFAPSDVQDAEELGEGEPIGLQVNFMGAATPGVFGSLPRRYAEEIRALVKERNYALRDFIDLFNHRIISLYYRSQEKNIPTLAYERGSDNAFDHTLWGLLGIATPGLTDQLALDDRMIMGRAGLLAMRPMGVSALEGLVRSVFGVKLEVEQFCPATYPIEDDDRNELGLGNTTLGEDFYLGAEITLVQSKVRVKVGPLSRSLYDEFLPGHRGFERLADLIHFALGEEFDFEVQLILAAEEVPEVKLGDDSEDACRLGWTSWLASDDRAEPAADALIDPRFHTPAQRLGSGTHATL